MKFRMRYFAAYKINNNFPVITRDLLEKIIGKNKITRLKNFKYTLDLSGMNFITEFELMSALKNDSKKV
jgi:hypothetical protein